MVFYKGAFSTIGIDDYLPYRLVGMALTVAAAALFLVLGARRVGYLIALPGAVLLLFLGSSSEVTATALRIPTQIAVVAGLGMLLALERRDLRGDLAACVLLLVSITSHPLGTAFAAAAIVLVVARPIPERWRRAWVFGVPLLLFGAWYVTLRQPLPEGPGLGDQLGDLPRFEAESLAVMAAAATGVFRSPISGEIHFLTPLTAVVAAVVAVTVCARALTTRMPASFWAIVAAALVLFAAPAFASGQVRSPAATRYIFPGVIMLLLLLAEVGHGANLKAHRVRVAAGVAVAVVFLFAIFSNARVLEQNAQMWATVGSQVRAALAAEDLARGHIDSTFRVEDPFARPPIQLNFIALTAEQYFTTASTYGSPAFTPAQARAEPPAIRGVTDVILARALALRLAPAGSLPRPSGTRPRVLSTTGEVHASMPGCVTLMPGGASPSSEIELPAGGVALAGADERTIQLALARFGAIYTDHVEPLLSSGIASLKIPSDTDPTPWKLLIRGARRPVEACGLAGGGG